MQRKTYCKCYWIYAMCGYDVQGDFPRNYMVPESLQLAMMHMKFDNWAFDREWFKKQSIIEINSPRYSCYVWESEEIDKEIRYCLSAGEGIVNSDTHFLIGVKNR